MKPQIRKNLKQVCKHSILSKTLSHPLPTQGGVTGNTLHLFFSSKSFASLIKKGKKELEQVEKGRRKKEKKRKSRKRRRGRRKKKIPPATTPPPPGKSHPAACGISGVYLFPSSWPPCPIPS